MFPENTFYCLRAVILFIYLALVFRQTFLSQNCLCRNTTVKIHLCMRKCRIEEVKSLNLGTYIFSEDILLYLISKFHQLSNGKGKCLRKKEFETTFWPLLIIKAFHEYFKINE